MSSTHPNAVAAALERFVDDAALFPPARTPLVRAVPAHAAHRSSPHGWMVGRFVCPASRLAELADQLAPGQRVAVSVVCDAAGAAASFAAGLRADLALAAAVQRESLRVEAVEIPPAGDDVAAAVADSVAAVAGSGLAGHVELFCELAVAGRSADAVARAVEALAAAGSARPDAAPAAVKVRCGGADARGFPTAGELAGVVVACRDAGIRFKATAGLHHPHRHPDPDLGVDQHGFLNLLAAAAAACVTGADARTCEQILAAGGPQALRLDPHALHTAWGTYPASAVARTRSELFTSFGSCSIHEPVEHLADLGVLTAEGAVA